MLAFLEHPLGVALTMTFVGSVLSLTIWMVKRMNDVLAILIGPDGRNGVRGDVKEIMESRKLEQIAREENIRFQVQIMTEHRQVLDDIRNLEKRMYRLERGLTTTSSE